ncbi:MAG TPA: glycoside hydrolase family 3 C-terminal domain-containing protein [Chitinophagaceae bacterium]|nr:glycoside hydrolase family 3 C-terminal domain-containing protein [Chitinophagaceae bacterium]
MQRTLFIFFFLLLHFAGRSQLYLDPAQPLETRIHDLLKRMTLEEKASQLNNTSPAIDRLHIPEYNWWNEALHGVARAGLATSFPQPIGLAATFDSAAIYQMGVMISDEARAKYKQFIREGKHGLYEGLTFYSPNINIFRDPRWGRGHETYGEDPYLTGIMGTAFVKAMQGNNPRYFKTICTAKHFAVHSGPEPERHSFDADPSKEDLWETYLPAFRMLAQDAKVYSFMCAYNRLYGEPCCSSPFLLSDILRKKWGFKGFIATDCGAVYDMFVSHHTAKDSIEAMAAAIRAGVDNHCMGYPGAVLPAIRQGLLKEAELDTAVARLLRARFKLGMFDPEKLNPYDKIPASVINDKEHRDFARKLARESIVLLKNKDRILPLSLVARNIAIIGPNADDPQVQLGNYNGEPASINTPLHAIEIMQSALFGNHSKLVYRKGCHIVDTVGYNWENDFSPAIEAASKADIVLFFGGISPRLEGEELPISIQGFKGGDKTDLELPPVQTALLKELKKTGKPIILVLMNGSALSINWENENVDAIIESWYGGEEAGTAISDVLFGSDNPAGRLPITFYKSINDIPAFTDYSMKGKTYRFCEKPVLYPFGYGLSYTDFEYSNLKIDPLANDKLRVSVAIKNTGKMAGDEVAQLYIHQAGQTAIKELKGFKRINLKPGESKSITFIVTKEQLKRYDVKKDEMALLPGKADVLVGTSSADIRLRGSVSLR